MKAIFLADAHLRHPDEAAYRDLLEFLELLPADLDYLFLLGDIFDFWCDSGKPPAVYKNLLAALKRASAVKGRGLHLFAGNHEISGGSLLSKNGLVWHERELIIRLDGLSLYLAHGDLFNREDYGYRLWRALLRAHPTRALIARLPPRLLQRLAATLSQSSRGRKKNRRQLVPAPVYRRAARILRNGREAVIIGHYHQARRETFVLNGETRQLLMLGGWENERAYLELANGRFTFRNFRPSGPENV